MDTTFLARSFASLLKITQHEQSQGNFVVRIQLLWDMTDGLINAWRETGSESRENACESREYNSHREMGKPSLWICASSKPTMGGSGYWR